MAHAVDVDVGAGSLVVAARRGVVVETAAHFSRGAPRDALRARANFVIVRHHEAGATRARYTRYYHLSRVLVSAGDAVAEGQLLGLSGNTGFTFGAHLHFDVVDVCGSDMFVATLLPGGERLPVVPATFSSGPPAPASAREMRLVAADPLDASRALLAARDWAGAAVVCVRGGPPSFREKADACRRAGAACCLIVDNDESMRGALPLLVGAPDGGAPDPDLVTLFVAFEPGQRLVRGLLRAGGGAAAPSRLRLERAPAYIPRSDDDSALDEARPRLPACKPQTLPFALKRDPPCIPRLALCKDSGS